MCTSTLMRTYYAYFVRILSICRISVLIPYTQLIYSRKAAFAKIKFILYRTFFILYITPCQHFTVGRYRNMFLACCMFIKSRQPLWQDPRLFYTPSIRPNIRLDLKKRYHVHSFSLNFQEYKIG